MVALKLRKLKWVETRRRLYKFIGYFIAFFVLNIIVDYFFKSTIDLLKNASVALGVSFGISFLDLLF